MVIFKIINTLDTYNDTMTHYKFFTVSDYTHCSFLMTFSPKSSNFAPPTGNKFDLKLRNIDLS